MKQKKSAETPADLGVGEASTAALTTKDAPNKIGLPDTGFVTAQLIRRRYLISNSCLYAWIAEGRFPRPVRIGPRAVRWSAESLLAFEATLKAGG